MWKERNSKPDDLGLSPHLPLTHCETLAYPFPILGPHLSSTLDKGVDLEKFPQVLPKDAP